MCEPEDSSDRDQDLATSAFQPFVAAASADGTVQSVNPLRKLRRRPAQVHRVSAELGLTTQGHYTAKVFRVDFSRKTGQVRMLDNLMPQFAPSFDPGRQVLRVEDPDEEADADEARFAYDEQTQSMLWPAQQACHTVAWHPSIRRAGLLASGLACGLVRVDVLEGPWAAERIPYESVAAARGGVEADAAMDES